MLRNHGSKKGTRDDKQSTGREWRKQSPKQGPERISGKGHTIFRKLESGKLNVVGENHEESGKRRQAEQNISIAALGPNSKYFTEDEFSHKEKTKDGEMERYGDPPVLRIKFIIDEILSTISHETPALADETKVAISETSKAVGDTLKLLASKKEDEVKVKFYNVKDGISKAREATDAMKKTCSMSGTWIEDMKLENAKRSARGDWFTPNEATETKSAKFDLMIEIWMGEINKIDKDNEELNRKLIDTENDMKEASIFISDLDSPDIMPKKNISKVEQMKIVAKKWPEMMTDAESITEKAKMKWEWLAQSIQETGPQKVHIDEETKFISNKKFRKIKEPDLRMMRSATMDQAANEGAATVGLWKIGDNHVTDIKKLYGTFGGSKIFGGRKYKLMTRQKFNEEYSKSLKTEDE